MTVHADKLSGTDRHSGGSRTLYLVRHGRVGFDGGVKRCIGHTDVPLSEEGRRDACALKDYFAAYELSAVYSSPLSRAYETACILSGGRYEVITDPGLSEIYMGEWENRELASIKKDLETEPILGEGRKAALARFSETIKRILSETAGDIVVVAHAGVNCAFLSYLAGTPLETSRGIRQPYGCINIIKVMSDGSMRADVTGICLF